jgi:chromosomal replication initiator protein
VKQPLFGAIMSFTWDYNDFWKEALSQIRLEIGEQEFLMWFNLEYVSSTETTLIISVPSAFYRDQVSHRYLYLIESKLHELTGKQLKIVFEVALKKQQINSSSSLLQTTEKKNNSISDVRKDVFPLNKNLKPEFSFENYIIGENNSFAANAAYAIAKNPGSTYNPFLIYGGVGLGKTHLMQAIGNLILSQSENTKLIFITAEEFVNEFIQSFQDKTTNSFKNKYRHIDILLIDDIHFFQNKQGSQEELFHTFNALYDNNKQLVFTCDRPVSELKNLSDRLRSRFERGLNVDLQPPNYETRVAILKVKSKNMSLPFSNEVIELIAKNISTNIRDLEAALIRLKAYSELVQKSITLEIAQAQLKDMFSQSKHGNITIDLIQKTVSDYFNLSIHDLKGKKKTKVISLPRQIAMYITRELTEFSTTEIGNQFGGRDHTTVMHSYQKVEEKLTLDPTIESTIQKIIRKIKENSTT